jgi:hypothetical protein
MAVAAAMWSELSLCAPPNWGPMTIAVCRYLVPLLLTAPLPCRLARPLSREPRAADPWTGAGGLAGKEDPLLEVRPRGHWAHAAHLPPVPAVARALGALLCRAWEAMGAACAWLHRRLCRLERCRNRFGRKCQLLAAALVLSSFHISPALAAVLWTAFHQATL